MTTEIAIVGVGCRFPDADTPEQFWHNVDDGLVSVRELPTEELLAAGVPKELMDQPDYVRMAASLAEPALFAAEFFGYPRSEAELIDPQQRLFLEVCWEALERAGHPPSEDPGLPQVGVFAGASFTPYTMALQFARARSAGLPALGDLSLQLGGGADFMAARVSHKLGLRGPSVAVQTACSSGLTAVHYAVLSLLSGECDIALAGASGLALPAGYRFEPGGILSEDGYCRAFDARSSGTSVGSGVGVVALRRLADALADRDPVLAVVCGSAVGNDGGRRPGFTAPTPSGPAEAVSAALRVSGVDADALCYVEAHGSGTQLGDHVELRGLTDGLRPSTSRVGYCALGSVKVNIGHTGSAAGIAGLIKAVHVASTGSLPGHPLFERPRDPGLLAESPLHVPTLSGRVTGSDRYVLVNSMGLGGTNAAAVLSAPPTAAQPAAPSAMPVPETVRLHLSACTRTELDAASHRLADALEHGGLSTLDVAYTLRVGRRDLPERRVVAAAPHRLAAALRLPRPPLAQTQRAQGGRKPMIALAVSRPTAQPALAALLTALGKRVTVLDSVPEAVPDGAYLIIVGSGEPGDDRCILPTDATVDQLDELLAVAWLHGVQVDWTWSRGAARRVSLPTYPFRRSRFWALDDLALPPPLLAPTLTPEASRSAPEAVGATTLSKATAAIVNGGPSDEVEQDLVALWRDLFGMDMIGLDDEFGMLGGTSLLWVQMALEMRERHGVLVNLHRAGGSRATVRRLADIVRAGIVATDAPAGAAVDDIGLVDADLNLSLGPLASGGPPRGADVLLTGASGFVGTFLLNELLSSTGQQVYCLVRADDEEHGWRRLRATAARFRLAAPDRRRVVVVPGDLRDVAEICEEYCDGELARRIGSIIHCGARAAFAEPYRALRADNVLPTLDLVNWARANRIADFTYISSLTGCGPVVGADHRIPEQRDLPLDPQAGGYGVTRWVSEQLLARAGRDGMRVRVFRPCFIGGSTDTGACNPKDLVWQLVAASIAVGAHPLDGRPVPTAPIDQIAKAVVGLAATPGSVGRSYNLVSAQSPSLPRLFGILAEAGFPTRGVPASEWLGLASELAQRTGNAVLVSMATHGVEEVGARCGNVECGSWESWLAARGLASSVDKRHLRAIVHYLSEQPEFDGLLADRLTSPGRTP